MAFRVLAATRPKVAAYTDGKGASRQSTVPPPTRRRGRRPGTHVIMPRTEAAHDEECIGIVADPHQFAGGVEQRCPRRGQEHPIAEIHAVVTATTERDDGGDEGSRAHVSLQGLRRSRVVVRDTSPDIAAYREKRSAGPDAGRPRVLGARHCRSAAPLARPRASSEGKVDPAGEAG